MKLVLTDKASADLAVIRDYTRRSWGPAKARSYLRDIRDRLRLLVQFPELGQPRDDIRPGVRSVVCRSHLAFYRIDKDAVTILRVLHVSQDHARHL